MERPIACTFVHMFTWRADRANEGIPKKLLVFHLLVRPSCQILWNRIYLQERNLK